MDNTQRRVERRQSLSLEIKQSRLANRLDLPITPPARENSEVGSDTENQNIGDFSLTTESLDIPSLMNTAEINAAIQNGVITQDYLTNLCSTLSLTSPGCWNDVDLTSDSDYLRNERKPECSEEEERQNVLAALQKILTENNVAPADVLADLNALRESEYARSVFTSDELSDLFGPGQETPVTDDRCIDSMTPKEELGLTTTTMSELNFSWNSSLRRSSMASTSASSTNRTSAYTNQYLTDSASIRNIMSRSSSQSDGKQLGSDVKHVVRWNSRLAETLRERRSDEEDEAYDGLDPDLQFSRNASRLALESREAMFRRAMTLLSARCNSTKQIDIDQELPFGIQVPKYFYVLQEKPVPMEPLKAWRGYNGNIYFQPINVCPLKVDNTDLRAKTSLPRQRAPQRVKTSKSLVLAEKENHQPLVESRSESRQTAKSSNASRRSSNRQMAILDKQTVLNRLNDSIHEDLVWLEGQESTGSLAVRPKTYPDRTKEKERDLQYNKERIKKGSVVHKLYVEKGKGKPKLAVSGGKFIPPNSMSPLLRTQTQYSLSSHRLTTNSPDPYHLNDSKLPPLDQIRASLKHMDTKGSVSLARGKTYTRSVTLTDDMKPFVKYSPDVVAKFNKQANIC